MPAESLCVIGGKRFLNTFGKDLLSSRTAACQRRQEHGNWAAGYLWAAKPYIAVARSVPPRDKNLRATVWQNRSVLLRKGEEFSALRPICGFSHRHVPNGPFHS